VERAKLKNRTSRIKVQRVKGKRGPARDNPESDLRLIAREGANEHKRLESAIKKENREKGETEEKKGADDYPLRAKKSTQNELKLRKQSTRVKKSGGKINIQTGKDQK